MPAIQFCSLAPVLNAAIALLTVATIGLLRRLIFHPLAKFPGPKLAGATWWYMMYYEVFKDGAFIEHLNELHAQYGLCLSCIGCANILSYAASSVGPVVRIGPNEVNMSR